MDKKPSFMVGAVHRVHAKHFPRLYCKTATSQDPNPPGRDLILSPEAIEKHPG